jgi:hypothetical protein
MRCQWHVIPANGKTPDGFPRIFRAEQDSKAKKAWPWLAKPAEKAARRPTPDQIDCRAISSGELKPKCQWHFAVQRTTGQDGRAVANSVRQKGGTEADARPD